MTGSLPLTSFIKVLSPRPLLKPPTHSLPKGISADGAPGF